MQHQKQLYLSLDFPEVVDVGVRAPRCGIIVSMSKGEVSSGGLLLPTSGRMTPDVGTVVSVGSKYEGHYPVGTHVGVVAGEGLYFYDYDGTGHNLRFIADQEDHDARSETPEFSVFDFVPICLELGANQEWLLVDRLPLVKSELIQLTKKTYSDTAELNGSRLIHCCTEPYTFRNPELWNLTDSHALIPKSSFLGWVKD